MTSHVESSLVDLNSLALPALFDALTADGSLDRLIESALREDFGAAGDVTSRSIIAPERRGAGDIVTRRAGVVAGLAAVPRVLAAVDESLELDCAATDGQACRGSQVLGRIIGPLRSVLAAERLVLNLLGRLSGIATLTRQYVDAVTKVAGARAVVCDTRKTTPGLRCLEKYAVRCGGGTLHRLGLHDAALFKDNHLAHIPPTGLTAALNQAAREARSMTPLRFVQAEVQSLEQLRAVLACEHGLIDMVLLDNMTIEQLKQCVALRDGVNPGIRLEASGGIDLHTIGTVTATGVDRISVGALTHSAPWLDIALDVRP